MPKRKTPVEKPEEQFERFVETARKHGVDDAKQEAERLFKQLAITTSKKPPNRQT